MASVLLITTPGVAQVGKRSPGGWVDAGPAAGPERPLDWIRYEIRTTKVLPHKKVIYQTRLKYSEDAKREKKRNGSWIVNSFISPERPLGPYLSDCNAKAIYFIDPTYGFHTPIDVEWSDGMWACSLAGFQ